MILFSFLPIAPPGKEESISGKLFRDKFNTIPWVLIVAGGALFIFSLFSKSKKKPLYLLVSILLIIIGIVFLIW